MHSLGNMAVAAWQRPTEGTGQQQLVKKPIDMVCHTQQTAKNMVTTTTTT